MNFWFQNTQVTTQILDEDDDEAIAISDQKICAACKKSIKHTTTSVYTAFGSCKVKLFYFQLVLNISAPYLQEVQQQQSDSVLQYMRGGSLQNSTTTWR